MGHAWTGRLTNAQPVTKRVCVQVISTSNAASRVTKHVKFYLNDILLYVPIFLNDVIPYYSGQNNENVWASGDSQCKAANGNCMINTNYCDGYFQVIICIKMN